MMTFSISDALFMLGASPSSGAEGPGMIQTFGFMGLIFIVFWFFMIRPQRQKQKQREIMLKALEKGDHVVTIGGIRGTVAKVNNEQVSIKVDDGCKISFSRTAIAEVLLDEKETARRTQIAKSGDPAKVKEPPVVEEQKVEEQNPEEQNPEKE